MKIAISKSHNPYINLSTEEIILKDQNINEDIILFYVNENTIVLGRNQNLYEEINEQYVNDNHISVIRRISGGGSVYHDFGNINFSFITQKKPGAYATFLKPIIEFLQSLNLDAKFSGKNDLTINGYKISGNAQYVWKNKMFHHGTLLFDTDLSVLSKALKPNKLKIESKGIKSIRQRVININQLLKNKLSNKEFLDKLITFFIEKRDCKKFNLTNYKTNEIEKLAKVRASMEWNYHKNPIFNFQNEKRYEGGTIKVIANIENNVFENITFFGDFLSSIETEKIQDYFLKQKYDLNNIKHIINNIPNFDEYFGKLSKQNIIDLLKK